MTIIPLSFSSTGSFDSPHDYGTMMVQGGEGGTVFVQAGGSYITAYIECFPENSFLRGEGATLAEADAACWAKLQSFTSCEHQWEVRGYRNGGGICKHCGQFGSKVFTPEQLGLACTVCGAPTFHILFDDQRKPDVEQKSRCEAHDPKWPYFIGHLKAMRNRRNDETAGAMYTRLSKVANYGAVEDPGALAWAYANLDMSDAPRDETP
ncbi:hypothetical protein IV500_04805 [Paeniglutamicibacter antarcticus]|uniref:Uncharacterized protein n=1 Tax=Arthrobacter terrae TaxID=2935737 RepID=A0A931CI38_9MICC|nr:hypothetical protein [Arthrobacter terrae]MBG0738738.1 hypothetical protein [Arthrobacter terrae]